MWIYYLIVAFYVIGVLINFKILVKKDWFWVWLSFLAPIILIIGIKYENYLTRKKKRGF